MAGVRDHLARLFTEHGRSAHIMIARNRKEVKSFAAKTAGSGRIVIAGGGDGTVNTVASVLIDTDAVLGVLPLGTMNHFAKDLSLPQDLAGAVATILEGRTARLDVGDVNGHVFLNNSSLGAYSQLLRERKRDRDRGWVNWLAFAMATVATLRHPLPITVRVRLDGVDQPAERTPLLFVGNNRYSMYGARMGSRSRLDSGQLWICMAPQCGRARLMWLAMQALAGRLRPEDLSARNATAFSVQTQGSRVDVARDGRVTSMATPLHYRIRPAALQVMVPYPIDTIS